MDSVKFKDPKPKDLSGQYIGPSKLHPFENANIFSKLTFSWILPFIKLGANKDLIQADLFPLREIDSAEELGDGLERKWHAEVVTSKERGRNPKLYHVLWSLFWSQYIWGALLYITTECTLAVSLPIVLRWFILTFGNDQVTRQEQLILAGIVCINTIVNTFCIHIVYFVIYMVSMRVRVALKSLIYRKSLRLSLTGSDQPSIGRILNLAANDVHRLEDAMINIPYLVIAPIQYILFSFILYVEIGYPALVGVALLSVMVPFQYVIGHLSGKYRLQAAERTDERARFMSEIINGVRVIKMYAWEKPFSSLIHKLRYLEMKSLKKIAYLFGVYTGFNTASLQPAILATAVTYILTGREVSSDKIFYAVAIFNVLVLTLMYYIPRAVIGISEAMVTFNRLENYLSKEEQGGRANGELILEGCNSTDNPVISMAKLSTSWAGAKDVLQNLTLELSCDQLVIVVGAVGSGKSSLLNTLIGELPVRSGKCHIRGSISYASQEAWIFTGTIRENILFGQVYDDARYNRVVDACALATDFVQFEYGDGTLVGERGVTLSGGQKARVNLARALYRQTDIYLLDDPLSAVDARVSKHIFDKCLNNFLRGKLRVLVTHQLQYLSKADHIICLNENGAIFAQGTFKEMKSHNVDIFHLLKTEDDDESRRVSKTPSTTGAKIGSKVEQDTEDTFEAQEGDDEVIVHGKVDYKTYAAYFSASKSTCTTFLLFTGFMLAQAVLSGCYWWLAEWTNYEDARVKVHETSNNFTSSNGTVTSGGFLEGVDSLEFDSNQVVYLWIYAVFVVASLLSVLIVTIAFFTYSMRISVNIHDSMFQSLVRAPTRFFDTNSPGRILNRVTRDLSQMDIELPEILYDTINILFRVIGTVVIVIATNYYVLLPTGLAAMAFSFARSYYIRTIRDVKRLEAISRSPIFNQMTSTYQGITTIRSSKSQAFVLRALEDSINENTRATFCYLATSRWFAVALEMTALSYFTAITFGFLCLSTSTLAGSVGMAMTSIMELNLYFQWGVRQSCELENIMTCVERIQEYASLKPEAPLRSEPSLGKSWIVHGEIKFVSVSLVYDEKPVLRDLSFTIKAEEKIGVVGRTGAGKSSIIAALFRLTEPTGEIFIDGVCVNDIGLHDLRENISIIPQEPQLFSGTMRYNLDPFGQVDDTKIWEALEQVALKEVVTSLDVIVADGGSNFSTGERQLVCLARAILRKNKILVLDEATANVDTKTDNFIQNTIRSKFSGCTIITIAHRLQSVMDCDRILVLERGEVKEYDDPLTLLQNPYGFLRSLMEQTGKSTQQNLTAIAEEKFNSTKRLESEDTKF